MKPSTRRNLIGGLLLTTLLAVIFAPDDTVQLTPHSTKTAISRSPSSTFQVVQISGLSASMLPHKRSRLVSDPKDIFYIEKPVITFDEGLELSTKSSTPTAPPLPFIYMGKILNGGQRSVFLTRDQIPYVAKTGEVLDGVYRVDAIHPPVLELTYLPLSQKQTLNIGEEK